MARVLIVGCGCRGQELARELNTIGYAVRGTTRNPDRRKDIEAAGAEAFLADPDRVGTLIPALAGVTVMCLLLASATGSPEHLRALHTTRLEMLMQRTIDTTIHGLLYEGKGTIDEHLLTAGAELVQRKCEQSLIRYAVLRAERANWLTEAVTAIDALLAPSSAGAGPTAA
jgi:saccharopine dehydrogenase-like NADP-dependent oxidoreductase